MLNNVLYIRYLIFFFILFSRCGNEDLVYHKYSADSKLKNTGFLNKPKLKQASISSFSCIKNSMFLILLLSMYHFFNLDYILNNPEIKHNNDLIIEKNSFKMVNLLNLFGATQKNDLPYFLSQESKIDGRNKTNVDIGLFDGKEAKASILKGFTVFGFEPSPIHINKIITNFQNDGLRKNVILINVTELWIKNDKNLSSVLEIFTREYMLKNYPVKYSYSQKHQKDIGYLYLFNIGCSNISSVIKFDLRFGVWSSIISSNKNKSVAEVIVSKISNFVYQDIFWFKTDTQGFEIQVLQGAKHFFENYNVDIITTEYWPYGLKKRFNNEGPIILLNMLSKLKSMCFDSTQRNLKYINTAYNSLDSFYLNFKKKLNIKSKFYSDLTCI